MNTVWLYIPMAFFAGCLFELIFSYVIQRKRASGTIRIIEQKDDEPAVFLELEEEIQKFSQHGLVRLRVEKRSFYEN